MDAQEFAVNEPEPKTIGRQEIPGDEIKGYKLLRKIGEGGFGIVYLAEQQSPLRRKVALKIIKSGKNAREMLHRFKAEQQALAELAHSNIARVYDAGFTNTGRPYFAMEYIDGKAITEYCDRHGLTIQQRLKLFENVCHAVQHAHLSGIIHRDIKPTNILVFEESGVPVPKVIDFGIAKAMSSQPLQGKNIIWAQEEYIGTPAYMSPEQAGLGSLEVDRRTDIYSLGVVLYELLVGCVPFDSDEPTPSELLKKVRESVPPCPSARLKTLGERNLLNIGHSRRIEPSNLLKCLCGGLDRVVMKCLEKDREQRHNTANSLAADIEDYLKAHSSNAAPEDEGETGNYQKALWSVCIGAVVIGCLVGFIALQKMKNKANATVHPRTSTSLVQPSTPLAKEDIIIPDDIVITAINELNHRQP